MSVLIKGMEMPKNCYVCEFITFDSGWMCKRLKRKIINVEKCNPKDKDCPLVEVPAPHGNLIDIDSKITVAIKDGLKVTTVRKLLNYTAVRLPKTVIEAEDGDTE